MNEKTELSDERIKELAEQQGCWGASYGYSKESYFEKPVVPAHAYTFARAIEAELRAASSSSKSTTDDLMKLADEAIHAYAAWLAEFINGELPSHHVERLNAEKDAARERLRAALASSSIKEDGERADKENDHA